MTNVSQIINGDVHDALCTLESESADLIIADPPYGIKKNFELKDSWASVDDWKAWCEVWLTECRRILKPTGSIMVYGIHNYICYNQVQMFELGLRYRRQIIWRYENGFCGNRTLRATYEPLLWFSKSDDYYFDEIREPYKSTERLKYNIVKNGKSWQPNPLGRLASDVWDIPTLAGRAYRDEKVDHPTQKPLLLSDRLVRHFCPPDGHVVVPFAGSGSECVAAHRASRSFVGVEVNPRYVEIILRRLAADGWEPGSGQPLWFEEDQIAVFA